MLPSSVGNVDDIFTVFCHIINQKMNQLNINILMNNEDNCRCSSTPESFSLNIN